MGVKPVSQMTQVAPNVHTSNTLHMYICICIHMQYYVCMYLSRPALLSYVHTYILYVRMYMCTYVSTVKYVLTLAYLSRTVHHS